MSLAITTITPEGIVMAADSRQSYQNLKGVSRVGSDSAQKIFTLNDRVGIAITGLAFIPEDGVPKNVSKFIEEFKRGSDIKDSTVQQIAEKLKYLFDKKINPSERLKELERKIREDLSSKHIEITEFSTINDESVKFVIKGEGGRVGEIFAKVEGVTLSVAGYNKDGSHESFTVYAPGKILNRRNSKEKGKEYGADWIGQTDVVSRIIKGFDPRILNIPFVQATVKQQGSPEEVKNQLNRLEYSINWGAMPLQDAVDFSALVIETTSAIQRFSDGIQADPGDVPGVGGPVDVLVITPEGSKWVKKKEISL